MLFSDLYLQSLRNCLEVKIALAGYGSYIASSLQFRTDPDKHYLRCMMLYKKVLDSWDNRPGATNSCTEQQLAAVVSEIQKMPYGCDPSLLFQVVSISRVNVNLAPVVDAGRNFTTGFTTASLDGSAYDPEGGTIEILWTKLVGGTATITNPTTLKPTVSNLAEGSYVFQLSVRDAKGQWATDTVIVTCTAARLDTIYYGGSTTNIPYDIVEASVLKLPYKVATADSTKNIPIDWLGAYSGFKYPWIFIPARTADSLKTVVQSTAPVSNLSIELETYISPGVFSSINPGGLFKRFLHDHPEEPTRNFVFNGVPYVLYIGNWPTILDSTYIFKKL